MTSHQERIKELIERGEQLLDIYVTAVGRRNKNDEWYAIISAGLDVLTSLALTATAVGDLKCDARRVLEEDMSCFFFKLLGDIDQGSRQFTDVVLYE